MTDPDMLLVERAKRGDTDAFEALVAAHEKRMFTIAFRMMGNYHDACDVVQETFLSAYRGLKKFKGGAAFSTWLTSILMNAARSKMRKEYSIRARESVSLDEPLESERGEMKREHPSPAPGVPEEYERKARAEKVQECIGKLEPGFREMIVLCDLQEFTYEEASSILGVPVGTVKSRLFRAREKLKGFLEDALGGFGDGV